MSWRCKRGRHIAPPDGAYRFGERRACTRCGGMVWLFAPNVHCGNPGFKLDPRPTTKGGRNDG